MQSFYFECFCEGDYRPVIGSIASDSEEHAKEYLRKTVANLEEIVIIRPEIPGELHGRAYIERTRF